MDIGTTLREARMGAHIDMEDVERATKIRARYLRALENEEWDALPGPVYVKSFLRTYGDFLGLDSRQLVDDYKQRFERPAETDLGGVSHLRRERERQARGPRLPAWAMIGVVLVAVVVALWFIGNSGTTKQKSPTTPAALRPATHHAHRAHGAPRPVPNVVTATLVPTGRVYVCVFDGTGKALIPGQVFAAGQTVPKQTAPDLLVVLGNNAVKLTVNGKPVNVAPAPGAIALELTPTGTRPLPSSRLPRCA